MPALFTRHEAAERARISPRTLDSRIADGTGPTITKIGKRVLISETALDAWISAQTIQPAAAA